MKLRKQNSVNSAEKQQLWELWNNEYPLQLNYETQEDFVTYLESLESCVHFLLVDSDVMIGWTFSFTREHERWFGLIVSESYQNKKYGSLLLNTLKEHENELNGWVVEKANYYKRNSMPYKSPMGFYAKHDFKRIPDLVLETPKLSAIKIRWNGN